MKVKLCGLITDCDNNSQAAFWWSLTHNWRIYGLISDHYGRMVSGIKALVKEGQIKEGTIAYLENVPVYLLRWAPLIEGKWLHCYVAELALWGAILRDKGYQMQRKDEDHLLALSTFIRDDGNEPDQVEIDAMHQKAIEMLSKSPGCTEEIEEETFIDFDDFLSWAKRKVKVTLTSETEKGMVTSSWNSWIDTHGGEGVASVAGVPLHHFECWMDDSYYHLCNDTEKQFRRREQLLEYPSICRWKPEQKEKDFRLWRELALSFLVEICSIDDAVAFVSKYYFDGCQILFTDYADCLDNLTEETVKLVEMFNDLCKEQEGRSFFIDLKEIRHGVRDMAKGQVVKMVDMAKAQALESLGEDEEALRLVKKYL